MAEVGRLGGPCDAVLWNRVRCHSRLPRGCWAWLETGRVADPKGSLRTEPCGQETNRR